MTAARQKLLLFPCNGNAVEAVDCLGPEYECIGFMDDDPGKLGYHPSGLTVYSRDALGRYPEALVLAVPGSPTSYRNRPEIISGLGVPETRFARVIHPSAHIGAHAIVGYNTLLMAGVVVTSNARLGNHVCVLPNSVVHHDSVVGDYTLIGSNVTVAGRVSLGRNCYIGSGASIIQGIEVGDGSLIGMGSNVIRPVPPFTKVVGNPARVIR
jgi:sugar O-acyltransferase (sialic acid O-acetyltransferase NeuD family)